MVVRPLCFEFLTCCTVRKTLHPNLAHTQAHILDIQILLEVVPRFQACFRCYVLSATLHMFKKSTHIRLQARPRYREIVMES